MRIAVYHNLPSGGAKRSLHEMVKRMARYHEVDVYTLASAEHSFCDLRPLVKSQHTVPFAPLPLLDRPVGRLNQLIYLADLLRLNLLDRSVAAQIDQASYDAAFVHHCRYRQSPAVLRFLSTPTIYYCQEPPRRIYDPSIPRPYEARPFEKPWHVRVDPLPRLYRGMLRRHDRLNAQSCTKILVNSYHSRELVWRIYDREPVVCHLGVDTTEFRPVACSRQPIVLSVGAVSPRKGYDLLIKGMALVTVRPKPRLIIISNFGDARETSYLTQLAEQLEVSMEIRPIIHDSSDMATWYSRCMVTGFTPVLEPLGLVPLESMACATPVVGVREGGVRETVVDQVTGRLVDRDPGEVAQALSELLSHPNRAEEMGQHGRDWVCQRWTWEKTVSQLERSFENVQVGDSQTDLA